MSTTKTVVIVAGVVGIVYVGYMLWDKNDKAKRRAFVFNQAYSMQREVVANSTPDSLAPRTYTAEELSQRRAAQAANAASDVNLMAPSV